MRSSAVTIAFLSGMFLSATGAAAQTAPVTPAPAATPAPATPAAAGPGDDDVLCHEDRVTGSLFSKRVCHTRREWDQLSLQAKEVMDRANTVGRRGSGGGNGN
ncbi:MAG: hypothetical protein WDN03_14455 [Rhizomicrobium sp.]